MAVDLSSEPITETDEITFCVEMMKRLDIQRMNEQFCDVILEVGSGDDQARLNAHRIVLCAASPFFYNALNNDMKEKKEGVIRLEDTSKIVMEKVLEYLYTGHVDITEHDAYDLMAVSDYIVIPSLKVLSGNVILQTISFSNAVMTYYSATRFHCEELRKGARDFILGNFAAVTQTEDFLNLSCKQVEEWISSDEIIVKGEEEVFEVVRRWVEKSGREKYMYDLLQHVRLIYVPRNYLSKVILPHCLIKDKKKCMDLVLDAINCTSDGTEECFSSQAPRNCQKSHEGAIVACGKSRSLCYLPSENQWYELAPMLSVQDCYNHATSACYGKLYVVGGSVNEIAAECYEPSLNLWAPAKVPEMVVQGAAVATLQGFLYVLGGRDKHNEVISTVQRFNPDTNLWQALAHLSSPRTRVCAVADGSYLYAVGGCTGSGVFLDTVERFDPTNNTWERLPSTCYKRANAGGAAINQKVYVFGGCQGVLTGDNFCEIYYPATRLWSGIASPVGSRHGRCYTSAVCLKGKIFVLSCFQSKDSVEQEKWLKAFDVEQNHWEPCKDIPVGREVLKISHLRILKDVLATFKVAS